MLKRYSIFIILLLSAAIGCAKTSEKKHSASEATQKFLQICHEQFKYPVKVAQVDSTLWIYLPIETPIIAVKASQQGASISNKHSESFTINFLDSQYREDGSFHVEYDVSPARVYEKNYGYSSTYSEEYSQIQQNLLTTIQNVYFNIDKTEDGTLMPKFVIFVVADIKTGVEIENLFYLPDMQFMQYAQDEFLKRFIYELKGSTTIIGDTEGRHLDKRPMTLEKFLAKQITNRINFTYQRSSFPPSENVKQAVMEAAAQTLEAYSFNNFHTLELHDLANGATESVSKSQLKKIASEKPAGRLINIQFR